MKKIMMTVVAAMATVSMFAAPEVNNEANKNNEFEINNNSVARYLNMSYDQIDDMEKIHNTFARDMKNAKTVEDEAKREKATKKAILKDVATMRTVLSENQFRKYRTVLNATLNNRGIEY